MPIGVSAAQAALMPPVLMALPPTQQQLMAAAQYQASSPTGVLTRPGGSLLGTAAAAAQGNPVLVPQFVLPTSAGLFGALPAAAGTGVLLPLSVGMLAPPAVLMQPPGLSASSRAARGTPAAFGVMPAAAAAPGRLPAQQRPAAGAAAAAAGAVTQLPGSMVGVSAGGAVGAAVPRLSCMCVAPACLTEGQATQAQVYVVGLEGTKIEGATPGSGQVYRWVVGCRFRQLSLSVSSAATFGFTECPLTGGPAFSKRGSSLQNAGAGLYVTSLWLKLCSSRI